MTRAAAQVWASRLSLGSDMRYEPQVTLRVTVSDHLANFLIRLFLSLWS